MTDSLKASVGPSRFFSVDLNFLDGLIQFKLLRSFTSIETCGWKGVPLELDYIKNHETLVL